ncbi:MAG: hypothetical protein ABR558_06835 [Thioalkalivibrio sp.]
MQEQHTTTPRTLDQLLALIQQTGHRDPGHELTRIRTAAAQWQARIHAAAGRHPQ